MFLQFAIRVVSTAKVQKIWEQFTTRTEAEYFNYTLFRLQKYKKFESNSQLVSLFKMDKLCCFDCKSTKNLRAIHNCRWWVQNYLPVVSTAKVQKIWEQFTTKNIDFFTRNKLFRLQKYKKFESNSQPSRSMAMTSVSCFDCKSTKNLRAIHNLSLKNPFLYVLFRLQKYKKFESNSQPYRTELDNEFRCFDCKSTKNLRAIHNSIWRIKIKIVVVSTAKVQKIWEQFTTWPVGWPYCLPLFRLQKYKKFESNSQL